MRPKILIMLKIKIKNLNSSDYEFKQIDKITIEGYSSFLLQKREIIDYFMAHSNYLEVIKD